LNQHCFTAFHAFVSLVGMAGPSRKNNLHEPNSPPAIIASRDNRWLKQFRLALAGKDNNDGFIGVEGVRIVEAALGSGVAVGALLVSDTGERHLPRLTPFLTPDVKILRTTDRLFEGVADTQTPQGVAALIQPSPATLEKLLRGNALVVVMVGLQDPGNVGTILRVAEAFGATGAATCSHGTMGTADPFGPKALRASAGSAFRLPILCGMGAGALVKQLQTSGVKVYATAAAIRPGKHNADSLPRSLQPSEVDWKSPSALIIGNEGAGLPPEIVREADAIVSIPQATARTPVGVESLNAATAATVLLYEAMRQRGLK
jgi:TrmH family RNA methyltransferase